MLEGGIGRGPNKWARGAGGNMRHTWYRKLKWTSSYSKSCWNITEHKSNDNTEHILFIVSLADEAATFSFLFWFPLTAVLLYILLKVFVLVLVVYVCVCMSVYMYIHRQVECASVGKMYRLNLSPSSVQSIKLYFFKMCLQRETVCLWDSQCAAAACGVHVMLRLQKVLWINYFCLQHR